MNNKYFIMLVLLGLLCVEANAQEIADPAKRTNYFEAKKEIEAQLELGPAKGVANKQLNRWLNFWEVRVDEDGNFPNTMKIYRDVKNFKNWSKKDALLSSEQWRLIGPSQPISTEGNNKNYYEGLGRVNCVRFDPDNPNILWAGAASGGVWKSLDGGQSWNTFSFTNFLSLGVTDIAVAESNPDVVYVSTGDLDASYGGSNKSYSLGLMKTTNGGQSWAITNFGEYQLADNVLMGRVLVHPENENIVITSSSEGIFRTENGGQNWDYVLDEGVMIDMEFMPGNPEVVYASTYNLYGDNFVFKSSDNGKSWKEVLTVAGTSRTALAVTPDNPDKVYCLFGDFEERDWDESGFHSFYVSEDQGDEWDEMAHKNSTVDFLGHANRNEFSNNSFSWYNMCLDVDPNDEYMIFAGGYHMGLSMDGGESWEMLWDYASGDLEMDVHVDLHDVQFRSSDEIFLGTDGGIYKSTNQGMRWEFISNDLSITQFYRIGCHPTNKNIILGGSQDNGTRMKNGNEWQHVSGGDGMECAVDPDFPSIYYSSSQSGDFYKTQNGILQYLFEIPGGAWTTPFEISKSNSNKFYAVGNGVYYTDNKGSSWDKYTNSNSRYISLALQDQGSSPYDIVYAGSRRQIRKFTSPEAEAVIISPGANSLTDIEADPTTEHKFWCTNGGFEDGKKVFEVNGSDVKNISYNLPNIPVHTIIHQNNSPGRLLIGTDTGVFFKEADSEEWAVYGKGLPEVIINELEVFYGNGETLLRAGTYGRGIWEVNLPIGPTDVADTKDNEWTIGPVPARDYIELANESIQGEIEVTMLDMGGKTVFENKYQTANIQMDVSSLNAGVYMLVISNGSRNWMEKVIVE
jgi:photosystem II stability/assembly factor-like uncharacterized protein